MNHEKSNVYSISGFFVEGHSPNQARYFGGFFSVRTNPNEPGNNFLAMPFNGSLVDCYGMSGIEGEISFYELIFKKFHGQNGNLIQYCFERDKDRIWIGRYSAREGIGNGYASAKINLDWQGVDMIVSRSFDPEGWAKDLLEQMVDKGMLEIKRDEKTGEEVVVPR